MSLNEVDLTSLGMSTSLILNFAIWNQSQRYSDVCLRRMIAALVEDNTNTGGLGCFRADMVWKKEQGA